MGLHLYYMCTIVEGEKLRKVKYCEKMLSTILK